MEPQHLVISRCFQNPVCYAWNVWNPSKPCGCLMNTKSFDTICHACNLQNPAKPWSLTTPLQSSDAMRTHSTKILIFDGTLTIFQHITTCDAFTVQELFVFSTCPCGASERPLLRLQNSRTPCAFMMSTQSPNSLHHAMHSKLRTLNVLSMPLLSLNTLTVSFVASFSIACQSLCCVLHFSWFVSREGLEYRVKRTVLSCMLFVYSRDISCTLCFPGGCNRGCTGRAVVSYILWSTRWHEAHSVLTGRHQQRMRRTCKLGSCWLTSRCQETEWDHFSALFSLVMPVARLLRSSFSSTNLPFHFTSFMLSLQYLPSCLCR